MRTNNLIKNKTLWILLLSIAGIIYLPGCKKTQYPLTSVNTQLNITGYIESDLAHFSLFDQILKKTGYDGFLQAYGAYTVFVPNNDAVTLYMKAKGKASVNDFNVDSLKNFVRYHVIQNDTISTTNFIDGKVRTPTMLHQYVTTGVVNVNGVSSYIVNAQALILQSNISCGNGIIHVIDHVLQPATLTIGQLLANNPKYSIFTQALVNTGFIDTLNTVPDPTGLNPRYFTVFAESDSVYNSVGISSYQALFTRYSTAGSNPLHNVNDGLYNYMAYHILAENSYLTDILSKASHISISPGQDVVSDVLQNQTIQLDYDNVNGVQYPGASVDRPHSNVPATNGVLHSLLGDIYIKIFPPTRVDWDLADQPEFRKQTSIFRVAGKTSVALPSPMTNVVWSAGGTLSYACQASNNGTYFWWNDILNISNLRSSGANVDDISFTTPIIIKGKYKVWLNYQRSSNTTGAQFYVDGTMLQNIIPAFNTIYGTPNDPGPVLEAKGIKRYTEAPYATASNAVYSNTFGFYLGIVTITTTDHHIFRAVGIGGTQSAVATWDMVQFIPADQDQESPRYFRRDGTVGN